MQFKDILLIGPENVLYRNVDSTNLDDFCVIKQFKILFSRKDQRTFRELAIIRVKSQVITCLTNRILLLGVVLNKASAV